MPDKPILVFSRSAEVDRSKLGGGGPSLQKPTAAQQRLRLNAKFQEIAQSIQRIEPTVQGLDPEQVVVLETIGERVEGFAEAAAQIQGMEWLAEMDVDDVGPVGGFADDKDPDKALSCRWYAVMSNQQAIGRLIGLWNDWCRDQTRRARPHFGPFKKLFSNLLDLRRWGVQDRIATTGILEYLREHLENSQEEILFEVELWCRQESQSRQHAYEHLSRLVQEAGGQCLTQAVIPEILYHGVLVKMLGQNGLETISRILENNFGSLVRCEDVMFFRPFAQSGFAAPEPGEAHGDLRSQNQPQAAAQGDPIVALLDGLPLEQHAALRDRLNIDDADNHAARYDSEQQQHGTAMASLILHGDLSGNEAALANPVYVRPIFVPLQNIHNRVYEAIPENQLLVDLIHRAVRRIFEGENANPAAPSVKIINLSLGNPFQPFDRELSPFARLLDWLAWKYNVLFLVSVGNHPEDMIIRATASDWKSLSSSALRSQVLHAMHNDQIARRLFSPAEAVNVLTIGSIHADLSTPLPSDRRVDLLGGSRLPSSIGSLSAGFNRSVKPEIFFPGGRQLYTEPIGGLADAASFSVSESSLSPGQQVAVPGQTPMELGRRAFTRGTSNATALATRCGAQILERLVALRSEAGGEYLNNESLPVLIKCLLVHGARWGEAEEVVNAAFQETVDRNNDRNQAWREMDRLKTRFLGYGEVDPKRSMLCTDERVVIVGWSKISSDEGHLYTIPWPSALNGVNHWRRLTVTMAWFTPMNAHHRNYRKARLWFVVPQEKVCVNKRAGVDSDSARRGTVEHRVFEGKKVATFESEEGLQIKVNCKEDAGKLRESVPYAIAVTLEVAEELETSIYEDIRERIRPRVKIEPGGGG